MTGLYGKAKICGWESGSGKNCSSQWALEPELTRALAKSRDYDLLKYIWEEWRSQSGAKIKGTYEQFVKLSNKGARADGFNDTGDYWRYSYEDSHFPETVDQLWIELLPLYEQLHAYVRRSLSRQYEGKFKTVSISHIVTNQSANFMLKINWKSINFEKLDILPYSNSSNIIGYGLYFMYNC